MLGQVVSGAVPCLKAARSHTEIEPGMLTRVPEEYLQYHQPAFFRGLEASRFSNQYKDSVIALIPKWPKEESLQGNALLLLRKCTWLGHTIQRQCYVFDSPP